MTPPFAVRNERGASAPPLASEAFVVVRVGDHRAAWPVHEVREVRLPVPLVRDHALPGFADGALLVRRALVPVVDLRRRWSVPPAADVADRIVLTRVSPFVVGFVVDEVLGVVRAPARVPPPNLALPPGLARGSVRAVVALAGAPPAAEAFVVTPGEVLDDGERASLCAPRPS